MIEFSEDKDNPLNRKIAELWAAKSYDECVKLAREIFQMGIDDGQALVYNMRAGKFHYEDGTPGPGYQDDPLPATITVSGGDKSGIFAWDGKTLTEVHVNDNYKD
jgi:hypothetical protein